MSDQKSPTDRDVTLEVLKAYAAERARPATFSETHVHVVTSIPRAAFATFLGILSFAVVLSAGAVALRLAGLLDPATFLR